MDSEPSISTVHQAILTLYRGGDIPGAKEKASVWLGEFQKSLFAWSISDKLLHEKCDLESCYFAAQTMRTKIQYYFHELPPSSYESLRDSLLTHLSACTSTTDSVITTQLCLALADLYLQVPTWTNFVLDLLTKFANDPERSVLLLELLKVLVEELSSRRLRIGANRRDALSLEFAQQLPSVHEYLKTICASQGQNEAVSTRVLKCLGAWLSLPGLMTDPLVSSPLLVGVFDILSNPESSPSLHDAATECIVQALLVVESFHSHVQLTQLLFRRVHDLLPVFHTCVAREDSAKLENYCRIFVELAESVLPAIVDNPGQGIGSLETLDLLLVCVGHHDYTLAEKTFNVWYRLSEYVYQKNSDDVVAIFQPYVQRLLVALHRHCRFDADHEGIPTEHDDFDDFRHKVTDVVKDVIFMVGSTELFRRMFEYLQERGTAATWDETEATLYVMTSIAKIIIPGEDEVVPRVVEAITHLPPDAHVCVYYTAVRLVGELSEWVNANPIFLGSVLEMLLRCLNNPKLATVTTQALEALCTSCQDKMAERLGTLLEIVNSADVLNIDSQGVLGLLRSTAAIMSSLPHEELSVRIRELCVNQTAPLVALLRNTPNGDAGTGDKLSKSSKSRDPLIWLDRLAAIFRQLKPIGDNGIPHPCLDVVTELWPVLLETCDRYQENDRVVEHACRTMRFVIRTLGGQSLPLLTPLVTTMLEVYQKHPHSCFLYLGSILVDEYGQSDAFVIGLIQMLEAFVPPTFKILEQPNALRNSPDVVDDLFRLCIRFVQRAPIAYFQCNASQPLFQCALAAVSLDHRDACQSVNKFLVEFIDFLIAAKKKDPTTITPPAAVGVANATRLLSEFGQTLVQNLIMASVFHVSTPLLRDLADVLFELKKLDSGVLSVWLETALKSLPEHGTLKATPIQLQEFHQAVMSAQDSRQVTNALRDLARLYR